MKNKDAMLHGLTDHCFDQWADWLDLEAQAERERMARRRQLSSKGDAEKTGESLVNMQLHDHHTGLAGRLLIEFVKPNRRPLPMTRLKVGSPVVVTDDSDPGDHGLAGVVSRRTADSIQIALEDWPAASNYRIDLSPDETTRRRQLAAMARARVATGRGGHLRDTLLGHRAPRFHPMAEPDGYAWATRLNPSQQQAAAFALAAKDVAIIHGPPGTGKTTVLAEVIHQAVQRGERVLACAPSNTAVDNLLERVIDLVPDVVRVGHPARVFESLRGHTLDEQVAQDPSAEVIVDMRREIDALVRAAERPARRREDYHRRRDLFAQAGRLRGQIRQLERSVINSVLDHADVVCTTTTIDDDLLRQRMFDTVVIDEACQCTLPGVWQAVLRAHRLILAGDHCQLPPTVLSEQAARAGLRTSLMEQLVDREGESIFRRLNVQYRMHEAIMAFSSREFYDDSQIADPSVKSHRLCDLSNVENEPLTCDPLMFIDTAGADFEEQIEPDGESKFNLGEAEIITRLVAQLRAASVRPDQIAIIAPYAAQVRLLRQKVNCREIEIDSVDGFQGREKEVVLLTMVRSNERQEIGFLADTRRTNVAMTRARRKLVMVGDSATIGRHPYYADLLDFFQSHQAYHSVFQLDFFSAE